MILIYAIAVTTKRNVNYSNNSLYSFNNDTNKNLEIDKYLLRKLSLSITNGCFYKNTRKDVKSDTVARYRYCMILYKKNHNQ